jgi:hypothetical protein
MVKIQKSWNGRARMEAAITSLDLSGALQQSRFIIAPKLQKGKQKKFTRKGPKSGGDCLEYCGLQKVDNVGWSFSTVHRLA